jgi:hypothetical protein
MIMPLKMSKKFKCEHCGKKFSLRGHLATHTSTAKYCLKIRSENLELLECEYCKEEINLSKLEEHREVCIEYHHYLQKETYKKRLCKLKKKLLTEEKVIRSTIDIELIKKKLLAQKENYEELNFQKENYEKELTIQKELLEIEKLKTRNLETELARKEGYIEGSEKAKPNITTTTNKITGTRNKHVLKYPALLNVPIDNIQPLTVNTVRENVDKYTYDRYEQGKKGILSFIEDIVIFTNEKGERDV